MSRFLVVSQTHALLPYAHRLRLAGHEVDVVAWQHPWEQAWSGSFAPVVRGSEGHLNRVGVSALFDAAAEAEATVLTDVTLVTEVGQERGAPTYGIYKLDKGPKTVLRVGGWFDGERFAHLHLLLYDMGLWPGGLGPQLPGGLTLWGRVPTGLADLLLARADELKAAGVQGLCQVGVGFEKEGSPPRPVGLWCGWPHLHSQAFVSELDNLDKVLTEGETPRLGAESVTVIPLSVQPYPARARGRTQPIELRDPGLAARVFWHDVQVDPEGQRLRSGGLDGLVGVARGAGASPLTSRIRALQVVGSVGLSEMQWRPDAGARAPEQLAALEIQGF